MINENKFYVYMLVNPITNTPFYVGKGCGNRCNNHILEARKPINKQVNPLKCTLINEVLMSGADIRIEKIQENMKEQEAFNLETLLIQKYKRIKDGGCLSNISLGGDVAGLATNRYKRIYCYTLLGEYIEEFASLTHAADNTNIHKSTICSSINGRSKSAGGFLWSYVKKDKLDEKTYNNLTPVSMYTLEGDLLASFSSINEAATKTNTTFTSIVECADPSNLNRHTTKGKHRWARQNDILKPLLKPISFYQNKRIEGTSPANQIIIFNTINEACACTSANITGVVDCCAGRKKTSGGWTWRYIV